MFRWKFCACQGTESDGEDREWKQNYLLLTNIFSLTFIFRLSSNANSTFLGTLRIHRLLLFNFALDALSNRVVKEKEVKKRMGESDWSNLSCLSHFLIPGKLDPILGRERLRWTFRLVGGIQSLEERSRGAGIYCYYNSKVLQEMTLDLSTDEERRYIWLKTEEDGFLRRKKREKVGIMSQNQILSSCLFFHSPFFFYIKRFVQNLSFLFFLCVWSFIIKR